MSEKFKQKNISGWGGYPVQKANMVYPKNIEQILIEQKMVIQLQEETGDLMEIVQLMQRILLI